MSEIGCRNKIVIDVDSIHKRLIERVSGLSLVEYLEKEVEKKFDSIIQNSEIRSDTNLSKFLDTELTLEKGSILILGDLYKHYVDWNTKDTDVSKIKFSRFIKSIDDVDVKRGGGNIVKIYGLKLNDEWEL